MNSLVHNDLGMVHLLAALLATVTGTAVLTLKKGTQRHRQIGYVYVFAMAVLNITALMIYTLTGSFGVFHVGAILSGLTVFGGMMPAIKKSKNWLYQHLAFMYWSVIGLYAAFASESLTRIPDTPFYGMVGIASGLIFLIGAICYGRVRKNWIKGLA
ncbi:MAG: DUF2306 domain-containing protein [Roseivirga sp.]|nr:DUF2306 domain-containing protein [Roseivirga sp.]